MIGQHCQDSLDSIEDTVGCGLIPIGDVIPQIEEILPRKGPTNDVSHAQRLSFRRVAERGLRP